MQLYAHQKAAIEFQRHTGNCCLFHDPGLGKTLTILNIWFNLPPNSGFAVLRTLVVTMQANIESTWIKHIKEHTDLSAVNLWDKNPKKRLERLSELYDVYIITYDLFRIMFDDLFIARRFSCLILDDSNKIKDYKAQVTRAALTLAGIPDKSRKGRKFVAPYVIPHRYALTGTPAPNNELEYWPQVTFANPECLDPNFFRFRRTYFNEIRFGNSNIFKYVIRKDMKQQLMDNIAKVAHVAIFEDCVDTPPKVHITRDVMLSPHEDKVYRVMKRDLVLRFKDEMVLASTALTEIMKLRQLTSGFIYGEKEAIHVGDSKLKVCKEVLEEIGGHQVIIWIQFKYEMAQLLKELGDSRILGTGEQRDKTVRDFQMGNFKYLIAHPGSAGQGLTFTNCHYAVYYSLSYSLLDWLQTQGRLFRIGQKYQCVYYYLIAKGTIDPVILKAVNNKSEMSRAALDYLKGVE